MVLKIDDNLKNEEWTKQKIDVYFWELYILTDRYTLR